MQVTVITEEQTVFIIYFVRGGVSGFGWEESAAGSCIRQQQRNNQWTFDARLRNCGRAFFFVLGVG